MLAYSKTTVESEALLSESKSLYKKKFISKAQLVEIAEKIPMLHSNGNLLVRFGFFLLGFFLFSCAVGSLAVFLSLLMGDNVDNYNMLLYFDVLIGLVGTEFLAAKGFYRHGLDDAFILCMQVAFFCAIGVSFEAALPVFASMIIIGPACCVRYVNALSALIGCFGLTGLLFILITEYHLLDTLFLPFLGFLLAIAIYALYIKLNANRNYYLYANAIRVLKGFALVLGYFSVNYMVVRELSQNLMGIVVEDGNDIPLAFLFYGLTFIVPLFFIVYSLKTKDRMMLIIGLLMLSFSFFTIRYYYQLIPLEIFLILGGIVLFVIAFAAIKALKYNETGITFKPERGSDSNLLLNAQALILSMQTETKPPITESQLPFGGGGFSGGGAGGEY